MLAAQPARVWPACVSCGKGGAVGPLGVRVNPTSAKGTVPVRPGNRIPGSHQALSKHEGIAGAIGNVADSSASALVNRGPTGLPVIFVLYIEHPVPLTGPVTGSTWATGRYRRPGSGPDESRVGDGSVVTAQPHAPVLASDGVVIRDAYLPREGQ